MTNLVLFKNTPLLAALELGTLLVVSPLNGITHGGHAEWL